MIVLSSASTPLVDIQFEAASPLNASSNFHRDRPQLNKCQITDWHKSPSAWIFLAQQKATESQFIIKMLCPYRDTRYSLETLKKRQQCLLKALERNRIFTPELYIGLAPLHRFDLSAKTIYIGEVICDPVEEDLDADTEYILLMKPQDRDTRLDYRLAQGKVDSLIPLAMYIADMHTSKVSPLSSQECSRWGGYSRLIRKLEHNLELLDFLVNRCQESDWEDREELVERAITVKNRVHTAVKKSDYHFYFPSRIAGGYIRYCHGDIKSPHIWIAAEGNNSKEGWIFNLLDAIDFNPLYSHIDVLSDFAMLIADVQARAQFAPVSEMIQCYLQETEQDNEAARAVLDYYIMEKTIVGAGISILYDNEPELGRSFLQAAERHLASLLR